MSIRLRKWIAPDGKKKQAWVVDVVENDIRVVKTAPKGSREKEADAYEHKVRVALLEGKWCVKCDDFKEACKCTVAPAAVEQTVQEFSEVWQARNRRECAHGTVDYFYADCLKVINAQLGAMLIKDVRFRHVEAFKAFLHEPQTRMRKNKTTYAVELGPKTINNYLKVLRALLGFAEKSGKFGEDGRAPRVDLLSKGSQKGKYLTMDQAAALLAWVKVEAPRWYPLAVVMLATGLRIGEVIALEWRDIDFTKGAEGLHVNRVFYRGQFDPAGTAQRFIPLEAEAVAVLTSYNKVQRLNNPFVFPGTRFKHMTAATPRDLFERATEYMQGKIEDAATSGFEGVEPYTRADNVSPHVLRHTFATRKVSEGVPMKVLSRLMGHKSVTTTEIYAKVTDEALRAAMGQVKESK